MPDSYDNIVCENCPYHPQGKLFCGIEGLPLNTELNGSRTLLVLQSPGIVEWHERRPLANLENGAGRRFTESLGRIGLCRNNFDITNAIQCYQGKGLNKRDKRPSIVARRCCSVWLEQTINGTQYERILVFGAVAKASIADLHLPENIQIIYLAHPSGGLANESLDAALRPA